ncbi:MAG: restriction endonuclease [Kosmotogaceae bacterium]
MEEGTLQVLSLNDFFIVFIIMFFIVIAGIFALWLYKRYRWAIAGLKEVRKMSRKEFINFVNFHFMRLGYTTEKTRQAVETSADFIIKKNNIKTAVLVVKSDKKIGVRIVEGVLGAYRYLDCSRSIVVTDSFFSDEVKELAEENNIELWDKNKLASSIIAVKKGKTFWSTVKNLITFNRYVNSFFGNAEKNYNTENVEPVCAVCGDEVSEETKNYCLQHKEIFFGKVYCDKHQKPLIDVFNEKKRRLSK